MTPPARPDPVAALDAALGESGYIDYPSNREAFAAEISRELAESGYVLVNADTLAKALRTVRRNPENIDPDGRWDLDLEEEAAAILAALEKQP